tara:strand:- start:5231 stop:6601 length:1371 start_codon:yes stop_codon:yes gene_type:complete
MLPSVENTPPPPPPLSFFCEEEAEEVEHTVDLWSELRLCKEEGERANDIGDDESCYSSTDEEDLEHECRPRQKQQTMMVTLPCGDIHVCGGGCDCPYLEPNQDRILVCKYTGIEYGPEQTDEFFDLNGGIGKRSGDPDQACGELIYGKFQKRPDPVAASRAAYKASNNMSDTDIAVYIPLEDAASKNAYQRPVKRGALCVGEVVDLHSNKKGRISKKAVHNHDICANLNYEAEGVLEKLINYDRASSFKSQRGVDRVQRNLPPTDPRMCDETFVFNASVKKYVRGCMSNGTAPSIDAINNIAMMVQATCKKVKENASSDSRGAILTAKFRNMCCALIVALWSAACSTKYMENAKRGTDAYRPFICGVIYATKRGVTLQDGTVLVPKCPQLAVALPVLRGTRGNALAKTLHSSSHRGLCTLSRCIASVPTTHQKVVFADVIRMAKVFTESKFSKYDI